MSAELLARIDSLNRAVTRNTASIQAGNAELVKLVDAIANSSAHDDPAVLAALDGATAALAAGDDSLDAAVQSAETSTQPAPSPTPGDQPSST